MIYDPRNKISKLKDYFFPITILLIGIIISATIFWDKNSAEKIIPSAILPLDISQNERIEIKINASDPMIGNPKAPVTLIEFYDFQCGYCKIFAKQTLPKIIDEFVKSGKARIIFKDFAVLGEDSKAAAIAANCAAEQNKFLEYHDSLYSLSDQQKIFSSENILMLAKNMNLNLFKFNDCIGLKKNLTQVEQDTKEGKLAGVKGTPTFFINGLKFDGAQNFSLISSIINQELK